MKFKDLIQCLEAFAPRELQESYDNSGLQIGDPETEIKGVLIGLDCTPELIDEALLLKCNVILTHHPLLFKPLRHIGTSSETERMVAALIRNNIQLYAFHTNFDNVLNGVNQSLAHALDIDLHSVLAPKSAHWFKLVVFVPPSHENTLAEALFNIGAGTLGKYSKCSYTSTGQGSFLPDLNANPYSGTSGTLSYTSETRLELVFPKQLLSKITETVHAHHPYETPAYDILALENQNSETGSGAWGILKNPMDGKQFLKRICEVLQCPVLSYSGSVQHPIKKVGLCGGSGSFLIPNALHKQLDAFITADISYHNFFHGSTNFLLVNAGHAETEQFTLKQIARVIQKEFPKFAIHFTATSTSPVKYFIT